MGSPVSTLQSWKVSERMHFRFLPSRLDLLLGLMRVLCDVRSSSDREVVILVVKNTSLKTCSLYKSNRGTESTPISRSAVGALQCFSRHSSWSASSRGTSSSSKLLDTALSDIERVSTAAVMSACSWFVGPLIIELSSTKIWLSRKSS
jgi:hypothetical protein